MVLFSFPLIEGSRNKLSKFIALFSMEQRTQDSVDAINNEYLLLSVHFESMITESILFPVDRYLLPVRIRCLLVYYVLLCRHMKIALGRRLIYVNLIETRLQRIPIR